MSEMTEVSVDFWAEMLALTWRMMIKMDERMKENEQMEEETEVNMVEEEIIDVWYYTPLVEA